MVRNTDFNDTIHIRYSGLPTRHFVTAVSYDQSNIITGHG